MSRSSVQAALGVAIVIAWCSFSEARLVRKNLWVFNSVIHGEKFDPFLANQARFNDIKERLQPGSVVGYLSDVPRDARYDRYKTMFVQTQYALAPRLVMDSDSTHLVIGNFLDTKPDSSQFAAKGLAVVTNFGRGVFLLERER